MKKLLVWSGGLDSTILLLKLLTENNLKYDYIDTIYIDVNANKLKSCCEIQARKNIKKELKKYNLNINNDYIYKFLSPRKQSNENEFLKLSQPIIWLQYIVNHIIFSGYKYDEIYFGYVNSDSFWHIQNEFITAYENIIKIGIYNNIPKLMFPLEWYSKNDLIKKYLKQYNYFNNKELILKILNMTWSCENPRFNKNMSIAIPCKKCSICKKNPIKINSIILKNNC